MALIAVPTACAELIAVRVSPGRGGLHTRFDVRFRSPSTLGRGGIIDRSDTVTVAGPAGRGCRSSQSRAVTSAAQGATVHVTLTPGPGWCAGHFKGAIVAEEHVVCQGGEMCPQFVVAPQTIGRFQFTVTRSR